MLKTALRYCALALALFAMGPLAWMLVGTLRAEGGGPGATPLLSLTPVPGLVRGFAAVVLCCAFGLLVRRFVTPRWAYFCTGLALAWAAYGTGSLVEVLRASPSERTLWMLAVEALVLGAPVVVFAWLVQPHSDAMPPPADRKLSYRDKQPVSVGTIAFVVALVAASLGAWLIAQNTLKGQTIAAAVVGGLLAALAGHLLVPPAPPWVYLAGVVAVAIGAPVVAGLIEQSGTDLLRAAYANRVFAPARVLPLDWLAGGLIGVPLGWAWAASFVEKKPEPGAPAPAIT